MQLDYWDLVHWRTLLAVADRFLEGGCSLITSLANIDDIDPLFAMFFLYYLESWMFTDFVVSKDSLQKVNIAFVKSNHKQLGQKTISFKLYRKKTVIVTSVFENQGSSTDFRKTCLDLQDKYVALVFTFFRVHGSDKKLLEKCRRFQTYSRRRYSMLFLSSQKISKTLHP